MKYFATSAYEDSLKKLSKNRKKAVKKSISLTVVFFETGHLPHGLGMKPLGLGIWEIRAGLSERILFRKDKDMIQFLLVGNHDEIRRYLKNQ